MIAELANPLFQWQPTPPVRSTVVGSLDSREEAVRPGTPAFLKRNAGTER